jgi:glucose-6-phosphate isomerase
VVVAGVDVVREAHEELDRVCAIAEGVGSGAWVGATGRRIRSVVEISGGSHLGPALAYEALRERRDPELTCRFVSNLDPAALAAALHALDPAETLLVVVAQEPVQPAALGKAEAALGWLRASLGEAVPLDRHLLVVTARREAALALGAPAENVLRLPEWLDESRSLCSAAGLSACISLGGARFRELLDGFHAMDEHFAKTPLGGNVPAIAGLVAVWYRNFLGAGATAVVAYAETLRLLPAYVQQLSAGGGKGVTATGEPVEVETAPVVWGGTGTTAQDTFFQLLHRGTLLSPVDVVAVARADGQAGGHDFLAANAFAQAAVLAFGRTVEELEGSGVEPDAIPQHALPGNRPSSVILLRSLTPAALGALLAFYEHSAFTQAAIREIDPFGARVGDADELASRIAPELDTGWKRELMHDSSTNALIRRYRRLRDARR